MKSDEAVRGALSELVRDMVRSQQLICFHENVVDGSFPAWFWNDVGVTAAEFESLRPKLAALLAEVECPAGRLKLGNRWGESYVGLGIWIREGHEWSEIQNWATGSAEGANCLSPAAEELLSRLNDGDLGKEFISEVSLRRRLRYYGYFAALDRLVGELAVKRGLVVKIEEKGEKWNQRKHMLLVRLAGTVSSESARHALNPAVPAEVAGSSAKRRQFRRWFLTVLADSQAQGSEPVDFWRIGSRSEFFSCFPHLGGRPIENSKITEWLPVLDGHPAFEVGWDFEDRKTEWGLWVVPRLGWEEVRRELREELGRGSPEEHFGLTPAAAALFEWIQAQSASGLELGLTPVAEKAIQSGALLLECPWTPENLKLFLRLLSDEITRRTPWKVEAVPWFEHGRQQHRIWVKISHHSAP